jgi:F-type H+-transporting ATPase subunit b
VILFALMAQTHEGGQVETIARTFGIAWPLLAAQTISFAIVCALLYRFAYGPILRMLDERRKQIAQGLANAAAIEAKLASIEKERAGVIADARTEAAGIVTQARAVARQIGEDEKQRAAATAGQIVHRAKEAAELERARMMAGLQAEVGRLVVQTSASVIGRVLTAADQQRLAEEAARQLRPQAGPHAGAV